MPRDWGFMGGAKHAGENRKRQHPVSPGRLALSKRETAEALGVSVDSLEEHVMHDLRVVRLGRRRLIPVRELERWLDESAMRALETGRDSSLASTTSA